MNTLHPDDLQFFCSLAAAVSLSAAARELSLSTAAVSKRLAAMEQRLGVLLVARTTRRMALTPEGELYLSQARKILADVHDLEQLLSGANASPRGLLRVNATLGFGRSHIAPLISEFSKLHKLVEIQLQLSVNPPFYNDGSCDVCVRFGAPPDSRVIAKHLARNQRLLVASPAYIAANGAPQSPRDLMAHTCIGIRQGDQAYGLWRLHHQLADEKTAVAIKTRGNLSTNDGEIAVRWALDGHGILLRAQWDVQRYLQSGRLVQVLADYQTPNADIYAVYPQHLSTSARVKVFVAFLAQAFGQAAP